MPVRVKRRRYDDKFRAGAVAMLEGAGYPQRDGALTDVSKHLGIPDSTLHQWATKVANPPPEDVLAEARLDLSEAIRTEIQSLLKEMTRARDSASYKDLGIVFGVLVDKLQLLNNEPTENINAQIAFVRTGLSTIPEHLASGARTSAERSEAVQYIELRETVGED
jgi:transposase-like protein